MSLPTALATFIGKAVATKLIKGLGNKPKGAEKLAAVAAAVEQGKNIVEAFQGVFGDDFQKELNAALGSGKSSFSYEAGTAEYIKVDPDPTRSPLATLRDELNINLDRLRYIETSDKQGLKSHFRGMFQVWRKRYQELAAEHYHAESFDRIDRMLADDGKRKERLRLLVAFISGGAGATLIVQMILLVTGTGLGILALLSIFIFGISPLQIAGALIGGPALIWAGIKLSKRRDDDTLNTCIQLGYVLTSSN